MIGNTIRWLLSLAIFLVVAFLALYGAFSLVDQIAMDNGQSAEATGTAVRQQIDADATAVSVGATTTAAIQTATALANVTVTATDSITVSSPTATPIATTEITATGETAGAMSSDSLVTASPSPQPPTATPSATATLTLTETPSAACSIAPAEKFAALHAAHVGQLGCPNGNAASNVRIVVERFDSGFMTWVEASNRVIVGQNDGTFQSDPNWAWDGSNPDGVGKTPPEGKFEPNRGFGWLWRTNFGAETGPLGWALEKEKDTHDGQIQLTELGAMYYVDGMVFGVVGTDSGTLILAE